MLTYKTFADDVVTDEVTQCLESKNKLAIRRMDGRGSEECQEHSQADSYKRLSHGILVLLLYWLLSAVSIYYELSK